MTITNRAARTAGLALAALAASVAMAPSAGAATTHVGKGLTLSPYEARLLTLINNARAQAHLPAVTAEPGSTDVARRWALVEASDSTLEHNPNLVAAMGRAGSSAWRNLAENVGQGPAGNADALFGTYMASSQHRANILSRAAKYVGIGTVTVSDPAGGEAWNTITFVDAYSTHYGKARTSPTATVASATLPMLAGRWRVAL